MRVVKAVLCAMTVGAIASPATLLVLGFADSKVFDTEGFMLVMLMLLMTGAISASVAIFLLCKLINFAVIGDDSFIIDDRSK